MRTQHGDANDTRALVLRLVQLRAQQAALLGFADFASWKIADQMAETPQAALTFMRNIAPAARARAERELADIQQVIDAQQGGISRASLGLGVLCRTGTAGEIRFRRVTNRPPILRLTPC